MNDICMNLYHTYFDFINKTCLQVDLLAKSRPYNPHWVQLRYYSHFSNFSYRIYVH